MNRTTIALIATIAACAAGCGKDSKPSREVVQATVACNVANNGDAFSVDCLSPLRGFLAKSPDLRVMAITSFYRDHREASDVDAHLDVWLSASDRWPRAGDLAVDSTNCDDTDANLDCAGVIKELVRKPSPGHYFLVPIYRRGPDTQRSGTSSILDVHAIAGRPAAGSWTSAEVANVPCRLEKGSSFIEDAHEGVTRTKGDRIIEDPDGEAGARECESALVYYLRAHAAMRVINITALDASPTSGRQPHTATPGTQGLVMLMTNDTSWPRADSLAIERGWCVDGCPAPAELVREREKLPHLSAAFAVAALSQWAFEPEGRYVDELLWLVPAQK